MLFPILACVFHGGRVAGASALARGARVRVGGPFECPQDRLRQAQGERVWEGRVRWGMGDAMGDGDAPRRAPALGSRESGNDDGGCGGMRWREGLVSGWGPALAGGRFANRPYDRGGAHEGVGDAGAAGGRPPSSALRTGSNRLRANGFGRGACGGVWGMRWGTETPRARAPLDSCLRRNDARGGVREEREVVCVGVGGPSTGSRRTGLGGARSVGSGGCDGGRRRPAPRPCPGFPRERERRVAGAVRRYQRGRDSPVRANVEPRPWETAHS